MLAGPLRAIQRVIAVVGCQRSGTTLTGQILGAHPEAVLIDEPDGLYPWFHAQAGDPANAGGFAQAMLELARAKYRAPDRRFRGANGATGLAPHVGFLVLKAPNLTYDDEAFPRLGVPVTIVYPIRDPRAVVASMARLGAVDFVANQVRLMRERPRIAERYERDLRVLVDGGASLTARRAVLWRVKSGRAPDFEARRMRVSRFRYENLVRRAQDVIAHVARDCELPASSMLDDWNSAYTGFGPGGTDRGRAIDTSSLVSWTSLLSAQQCAEVLEAAQPLAELHGYR